MAVVADHDDGSLIVQQEVLQPVDGFDIKVVGRLVEHDDVGIAEEGLRQQNLDLVAGIGIGHLIVVLAHVDPKALKDAAGVGFRLPAVHLGKFGLKLGGEDPVLVGEVLFLIDGVLLLHHVIETLIAHDDGIHDRIGVILELVLLEDGHTDAGLDRHVAAGRLELARKDAQEGGFACAVGANDAVAVARRELQIDVLEQDGAGKLHAKIGNGYHMRTPFEWFDS